MALKKNTSLASGVEGEYWRLVAFRWDRSAREASAHFALYKDEATAAGGAPLVPLAAKVRLTGAAFDRFLGPAALRTGEDVVAQLYAAARSASRYRRAHGVNAAEHLLISDHGSDLFADASDA
ncbi:MAG: hypothetical protein FJ399_02535 [Verrucomicrobia bacterium]|nr:hypothetical protein [Verrucomicrobiota bacterium]